MQGLFRVTSFTRNYPITPSGKMEDDDSGGVAGPHDEPTMPKGAQESGRRPGAARRDECASRPPETVFRHRNPTILGLRGPLKGWGRS